MSFYNVSATAASNTTINSISAAGSASANLIDDLIRQLAAQDRQFANDLGGNNTVGGTADAITITPSSGSITAAFDGLVIGFIAGADNTTTSPTANVGGLGAEPIKKAVAGVETALAAGDIQAGGFYRLRWRASWDSAAGAWELVNPDIAPGLARVWANLNGTGTIALRDSYNVTSVTDNGTGDYTFTFITALANANYSYQVTVADTALLLVPANFVSYTKATTSINVGARYVNSLVGSATADDADEVQVTIHGDLA